MLSFYKRIFPYRLGNPADIGMERRRRSKEVVPLTAPATGDAVASVVDAVDALDKPLSAPSSGSAIEDVTDEERLEWYAVADEYWKEYLNDLIRKTAIEKMVFNSLSILLCHVINIFFLQADLEEKQNQVQPPEFYAGRPPLAKYFAGRMPPGMAAASVASTAAGGLPTKLTASALEGLPNKFGQIRPILRANFKK